MCNSLESFNVLITCGGGFQGKSLIDLLRNSCQPNQIFMCDINYENINKYEVDKFIVSPKVSEKKQYINFLYDIIVKYSINYIFPATTYDLILLSEIKQKLFVETHVKIIIPDISLLEIFLSKSKSLNYLKNIGLPVLEFIDIKTFDANNFFPIIAKPEEGSGSKGIIKILTYSELLDFLENQEVNQFIYNPLLTNFNEYSLDFSVNYNGNISEIIGRKRLFTSLGFALVSEIDPLFNQNYNNYLETLRSCFSYPSFSGIYNLQVLIDNLNGKIYFNDLNPRVGTSSVSSLFSGINIIDNVLEERNTIPSKNDAINPIKVVRNNPIKVVRNLYTYSIINKPNKISNIIFDLDGTIIDTYNFTLQRCINLFYNFNLKTQILFHEYCYLIFEIITNGKISQLIDIISDVFGLDKQNLLDFYTNELPDVKIYPDSLKALKIFKDKKYNLILLTKYTNSKTQTHKINSIKQYFSYIKMVKNKYSPITKENAFLDLMNELNLDPKETISVGDNFTQDIAPSIEANLLNSFYLKRKSNYIPNLEINNYQKNLYNFTEIADLNELIRNIQNY